MEEKKNYRGLGDINYIWCFIAVKPMIKISILKIIHVLISLLICLWCSCYSLKTRSSPVCFVQVLRNRSAENVLTTISSISVSSKELIRFTYQQNLFLLLCSPRTGITLSCSQLFFIYLPWSSILFEKAIIFLFCCYYY